MGDTFGEWKLSAGVCLKGPQKGKKEAKEGMTLFQSEYVFVSSGENGSHGHWTGSSRGRGWTRVPRPGC